MQTNAALASQIAHVSECLTTIRVLVLLGYERSSLGSDKVLADVCGPWHAVSADCSSGTVCQVVGSRSISWRKMGGLPSTVKNRVSLVVTQRDCANRVVS
jgi:hypothetical protein